MSATLLEIFIILGLVVVNGLLSMAELAVVSARRTRLESLAEEGDKRAAAALALANDPTPFLSTVQIGITLVGIAAGAFGGATLGKALGVYLDGAFPAIAPYGSSIGFAIVVTLITYLSLVVGELVPKRLALSHPERIARAVAPALARVAKLFTPFVRFLSASTELFLRLFGVKPGADSPVTEEEVRGLIEKGTVAGVFHAKEQSMVEGVFSLADRSVGALMTPRGDMVWLEAADTPAAIEKKLEEAPHSRLPVARGNLDEVLGIAHAERLLRKLLAGGPLDVTADLEPPLFLPDVLTALKALEQFRASRTHVALVVDEHGVILGLVTLTDILEAVIGEMPALAGADEQAVRRDDGSWLVDGRLGVAHFRGLLGLEDPLPGEEDGLFETVAGFVLTRLGRLPVAGEKVEWGGTTYEVVDMDGPRVDKLLVTPRRHPAAERTS